MDWPELIEHLADQAGIEPWFYDIHGTRHETSLGTKLSVLTALGFDTSSASTVRQGLTDLALAQWESSNLMCGAGRANEGVDVTIAASGTSGCWRWRLELESGEVRVGEFRNDELPLKEATNFDSGRLERRRLTFEAPLPEGYHRLSIEGRQRRVWTLIAVPSKCFLPRPLLENERLWGLSAHLYALRSERNSGIGDFGDLRELVQAAGQVGASFVAVNPFHALHGTRPEHASPYSPSSRLFLDPLYIELPDLPSSEALANLRRAAFVDYSGVAQAKREALKGMWAKFAAGRGEAAQSADWQAFTQFKRDGGDCLHRYATFCALEERFGPGSWHEWPAEWRQPDGTAVSSFGRDHADHVDFHMFLQFLAERQLAHAHKAARSAGMAIGVVRDLALGIDPDGADAWMGHDTFVRGLRCGAPRDAFHPQGQEWGVLPFNPIKLRTDHASFVNLLRANMRHAGGLRIDHIIGVERQFLVPVGEPATLGCYLRFPREQLVGLIALESRRNQCMVIGEDLGTVPEGLRQRMHDAQMFGCSILPFERGHAGEFRAPDAYRTGSLAAAGTHDLPTICGYWKGADIALRERLGLLDAQASAAAAAERLSDKKALLEALARKPGLLRAGVEPAAEDVRRAIHAFLASSAASLFAAQLDDLLDEAEQLNVPGTVDAYPNWRRKLSVGLEDPKLKDALEELAQIARHFGRA